MQTFTNFVENEWLTPLIEDVAFIIANQEKEPMEFILDWSKQFPEVEILVLEKLNQQERDLAEAGMMSGIGGAIGNFFQGGLNRLKTGYQQGSEQAKFQNAIKAVQNLVGLIGRNNSSKIINYLTNIQQRGQQPPVQAQRTQQAPQQAPQQPAQQVQQPAQTPQQAQQPQMQTPAGFAGWSPENQQQWMQRQQQIAAMRKAGRLGS